MTDTTQLVLPSQQIWVLIIGSVVPLVTYVFNKWAPWKSEQVKAIVQVVVTGIVGVAYTALAKNVHGFTDFSEQAFTAILSGLFAHNLLWKPSGLNLVFGANPPIKEVKAEVKPLVAPEQ
jgi:TctA family transporter